ncbi:response regulator transcription factor [Dactylosporangium sp. NPDC050688]|uniref:response regulator transcription factor n=1 Tax=Dactylosporangium sp. NPDC050688 TaxID=3157217 RepID=UPI0034118637
MPRYEAGACRVAIIDEQPITRAGMERVLADEPGFTVGTSVSSVEEIDMLDGAGAYGVAVVAISSRDVRSCVDIVTSVSAVAYPVVTSTWDSEDLLWGAIRAGARGCVTRSCDQREMVMALRIAATGALYVSPDLIGHLHERLGAARRPESEATVGLAPREVETVRWIGLGLTQRQIATRMGLSEATVNTYAKRIRSKLKVNNKAELTRAAIGLGLLSDDRGARHDYAA